MSKDWVRLVRETVRRRKVGRYARSFATPVHFRGGTPDEALIQSALDKHRKKRAELANPGPQDPIIWSGKKCIRCGRGSDIVRFYAYKNSADGLDSTCIPCRNARRRKAQ